MDSSTTVEPIELGGRAGILVTVSGLSGHPDGCERLLEATEAALDAHRLGPADVLRNRLIAATPGGREAASSRRFDRWNGPSRSATSSYIDAALLGGPHDLCLETYALPGAGAVKLVEEYEPRLPWCRFVAAFGLVYFSGVTSAAPTFERQIDEIREHTLTSHMLAGARLGRPIVPIRATVYVKRGLAIGELELAPVDGISRRQLTIRWCDGFANVGKLIEFEIDGRTEVC
jgi:hypothetical protein